MQHQNSSVLLTAQNGTQIGGYKFIYSPNMSGFFESVKQFVTEILHILFVFCFVFPSLVLSSDLAK